jgi:zinc protease
MIIDRSRQPAIQNLSELKSIPIEHTILPNGIPLTIINAEEQDVVSIDFLFDGGLWVQEMNYQAGFTNIMLNEGTTKYSSAQLAERFDFYGSEIEKGTLPQYTYITAYSLNKYFEQTIELVSSMIKEPTFPESEFQTHINCSLDSFLIQNSKTSYLATKYLNNALFGAVLCVGRHAVRAGHSG